MHAATLPLLRDAETCKETQELSACYSSHGDKVSCSLTYDIYFGTFRSHIFYITLIFVLGFGSLLCGV